MANKDLFKQAIADAKSVRDAAIANAKVALEESLTPQLKELLAQRLAEMEEEDVDEEVVTEEEIEEVSEKAVEEAAEEEVEEVVAEADEDEEADDESEESDEEAEDEAEGEEPAGEEEIADSDMTIDDLKDMIRDILSQEMGDIEAGEAEVDAEEEHDAEAEDMAGADMTAADDEEINLEELMNELAEMARDEEIEEGDHMEEGDYMEEEVLEEDLQGVIMQALEAMKTLNPIELAKFLKEAGLVDNPTVGMANGIFVGLGMLGITTLAGFANYLQNSAAKFKSLVDKVKGMVKEEDTYEGEMNEALETIETLRNQLNETNLLNAKLLYVNKVFKANNLNESQKANVIAAFDKAETVKEVKLVFETVSENIPSGNKKEVVREARGFASAAVGKSDKPEVIAEANSAVLRMQKLAGIVK